MFKKVSSIFLLAFLFFLPILSLASENNGLKKENDIIFKAKVVSILDQIEKENNGQKLIQQDIKLMGLEGQFKNKEIIYRGISELEIIGGHTYSLGNKVLVLATRTSENDSFSFYITDYVRSDNLVLIFIIFVLALLIVGRLKGLRSILSLFLTFVVIIFFIVPQIMGGANPVLITSIGSLFILFLIIYLTEGINLRSHLSAISMFISLLLVIGISSLFIFLIKLNGAFSEDVFALINIGKHTLNLKGMLLAGMIIGALGVLDDVIISQVVAVEQLLKTNPLQTWKEVFAKAYTIGISHISSMTNTLFLAYAGASLPLLILFISPDNPFTTVEQILNNEAVSTEIVRALSGSLGIILSVPISTLIASWVFVYKNKKKNI